MTFHEGLLLARLVFGVVMAAHGAQKLFGWFGGYGIAGTGGFLESIGFRPGKLFAFAAGFAEFASGVLIALGFLGPIGPALMLSVMIVAAGSIHLKGGLFAQNNGIELPLLYSAAAVALALTGFGAYSFDAALGIASIWTPAVIWAALTIGVAGALASLGLRRPPVSEAARSSAQ
jgi:putative oxidoreductase